MINETSSMSLFADKKILELRITNGKPGDQGSKALCELCENLNQDNLLLVILPKLDKNAQRSKWVKALEAGCTYSSVASHSRSTPEMDQATS